MNWEPNTAGPDSDPLSRGDFVNVHLNADPDKGHQGFVVDAAPTFIRLQVHQWIGLTKAATKPACSNVEVMYPMASVAFVVHVAHRPTGCACEEAAS